jgi:hypothetical protein
MLKGISLSLGEKQTFKNHENIPSSFRMILAGGSGSGKSTLLLHMILTPGYLDFERLYIFTSTPKQDIYQFLYHGFTNNLSKEILSSILISQNQFKDIPIPTLMKKMSEISNQSSSYSITVTLSDNVDEIIHPDKLDKSKNNLVIFDDCISLISQAIFREYFSRSRHNNANVIYLTQSYFDLDRMIRLNANYIVLFKMNPRNLNDIYNSVLGSIMDKQQFITLARNTYSKKYIYLAIDKERDRVLTDIFVESTESDSE